MQAEFTKKWVETISEVCFFIYKPAFKALILRCDENINFRVTISKGKKSPTFLSILKIEEKDLLRYCD